MCWIINKRTTLNLIQTAIEPITVYKLPGQLREITGKYTVSPYYNHVYVKDDPQPHIFLEPKRIINGEKIKGNILSQFISSLFLFDDYSIFINEGYHSYEENFMKENIKDCLKNDLLFYLRDKFSFLDVFEIPKGSEYCFNGRCYVSSDIIFKKKLKLKSQSVIFAVKEIYRLSLTEYTSIIDLLYEEICEEKEVNS